MEYFLKTSTFVGNFIVDFDPKYKNKTIRELVLPDAFLKGSSHKPVHVDALFIAISNSSESALIITNVS